MYSAFADGNSWSKVVEQLQAKGYSVIAVQNPLTSFADDVAATKRAIAQMEGLVLLVGHSYGGMVISEAGKDPKVAGWSTLLHWFLKKDKTLATLMLRCLQRELNGRSSLVPMAFCPCSWRESMSTSHRMCHPVKEK